MKLRDHFSASSCFFYQQISGDSRPDGKHPVGPYTINQQVEAVLMLEGNWKEIGRKLNSEVGR